MKEHDKPYQTIAKPGFSEFKDRNSKFLGSAWEVNSEDEVGEILDDLSGKHPKSRHLVYAFRIGKEGWFYRVSDDGEPSGSSGRPVYNQILSAGLDNILVVVVRYFGGTRLGIPGLINAYGEAARLALAESVFKTVKPSDRLLLKADYALMGKLMDVIKSTEGIEIIKQDFSSGLQLTVTVEKTQRETLLQTVKCKMAEVPLDMERELEVEGLMIEEL